MRKKGFIIPDEQRLHRKRYLKRYRTGEEYQQQREGWLGWHPEYYKLYYKVWIEKHPTYFSDWRIINRKKYREYQRQWYKRKQEKRRYYMKYYMRKYRANKVRNSNISPTRFLHAISGIHFQQTKVG